MDNALDVEAPPMTIDHTLAIQADAIALDASMAKIIGKGLHPVPHALGEEVSIAWAEPLFSARIILTPFAKDLQL